MTLYIVLAVIRQAAQNFNIEQRSRVIVAVVNEIRDEWSKYTEKMDSMSKNFNTIQNKFNDLTGARRRTLEKHFSRVDVMMDSTSLDGDFPENSGQTPALPLPNTADDDLSF